MTKKRLLFVCLGNICRSPMAQGVFGHISALEGLAGRFELDSAGTAEWHVGKPPDRRGIAAAARRGIDISAQRARQFERLDFEAFDHILVMDRTNFEDVVALAPEHHTSKVALFLGGREVPDPYYGGDEGFDHVLNLLEARSRALIARLA
jgi:protein-tyrosine phosphatase